MAFNKNEILHLNTEKKRLLAFELLDSIDEEFVDQPMPEWKTRLIEERLENDRKNPAKVISWTELRR